MEDAGNGEGQNHYGGKYSLLILIGGLIAVWLWISWLYGWFPFSSGVTATSEKTMQDIPQNVLDSLTAPNDVPASDVPQNVLDSLTAPTESLLPDSGTP